MPGAVELVIGIDIGGTFTDFVLYAPASRHLHSFKLPSTPGNPAQAVLQGLERLRSNNPFANAQIRILHGSTVATNALLERKGARTALIATQGFADLLEIGRQNRPALYDLLFDPPPNLVPAELRFEAHERIDSQGQAVLPLDEAQVSVLAQQLQACQAESVAVCLLFSFLNPSHELRIANALRQAGLHVSASCEILPEYREYERASTTAVNAYVSPVLDRYLGQIEAGLEGLGGGEVQLRVMQSNGGIISPAEARRQGVRCILSGPAGGVMGAQHIARLADPQRPLQLITFDMGGTSTDVSLVNQQPLWTSEASVGGFPIRIPVLDIHTIGAGGGSIAYVDAGGALRVGPQSAGADPGPACYGHGDQPTVTDANLVLGRIAPDYFLGGDIRLDSPKAHQALQRLGAAAGLDASHAAQGVIDVVNAHMERALRVISVERGIDPRRSSSQPESPGQAPAGYTLVCFGGAGGLHAADLARRAGISSVLVPPLASTLSAFGMLACDAARDYLQTVMLPGSAPLAEIAAGLDRLAERGQIELQAEGFSLQEISLNCQVDLRYQGQSYELSVPFSPHLLQNFHYLHLQTYGYSRPEAPLEIVNLRVRAAGHVAPPALQILPAGSAENAGAYLEHRPIFLNGEFIRVPFFQGERLQPGNHIQGPAIVLRTDTTILLGPADSAQVDSYANLLVSVGVDPD